MNASIIDLGHKAKQILKALEGGETVFVLHRGKVKGRLVPAKAERKKVQDTDFFGMRAKDRMPVRQAMQALRDG